MSNPATYPRLIDILPVERIPQSNDFVEGILEKILSEIHYKDFTSFESKRGDAGSYALKLIFPQSLALNIGGTGGLRLLLNPGTSNTNNTEVYTLLNYRLDALKYKGIIDLNSFRSDPFSYIDAFL
ncbi:MAG: hypothetical protein KDC56_12325, partial [Flavobacteriaceae bacterium]|nr:hypothetical protein [Flavobacteriaceae bacterium]